ncbi:MULTISPECIES: hypothetical protein [Flavobacterium]|uniref:Molybdenum ABC transporter permease n=1 Tax=Flavobacterium jumunjinense TaxID=998845 RepID=A0ABV5GLI6_9FLAO|nr:MULTISPECIES: hypothetical protein [Flavobacterium]
MKSSNGVLILIVFTLCIIIFKVVDNRTKSINEMYGNNVGYFTDINSINNDVEYRKNQEQKKILQIGGGILIIFSAAYYFFKSSEKKIQ